MKTTNGKSLARRSALRNGGLLALLVGVGLMTLSPGARATPIGYMTAGGSATNIGNELNPPNGYDVLSLAPYSGSITASGMYELNPLTFDVGLTCNCSSPYTASGSLPENVTIGGYTKTVAVPYTDSINTSDTLTITGGGTYLFGTNILLTLDNYNSGPVGSVGAGILYANVAVPEPSPLLLFGAALGMLWLARRFAHARLR